MPEVRARSKKRRAEKPATAPASKPSRRWWIYPAATAVALYLAFQVYAPALNGPFVFDDGYLPYHSPGFSNALRVWVVGVRPLLMFSYWLNYQFSQEPYGFHITNVFIHLLNTLLIFLVVRKMQQLSSPASPASSYTLLSAFAATVFLLHPIQTESVSYIAGRSESLSVLFFLAAFAVFLYRGTAAVSWPTAIAVLALFAAALATKEHTLVLPALLLLTDYYWNPGFAFSGIRRNWRIYAPIALGAVGGLIFVARVLGVAGGTAGFGIPEFTWYQYFFTQCRAFFVYLRLLIFPYGQNLDWDYPASRNLLDHGAIVGLAVILALAAAALYFRRRYPLASYGFLVYILLLAPTSSIVPIKDPVAERRLYLPMIGILLIVTAVLQRVRLGQKRLATALGVIVAVLAFVTYQRNQLWASDIALWEDAAAKSPGKVRVLEQLARTYYDHNRYQDAVNEYARAAEVQQPDYGMLVDWGLALDRLNQPDAALAKLRQAAALGPTAHVYTQIAMVYGERGRWADALQALDQAEKLDAGYDMIYDDRGVIRSKTNDWTGAAADFQRALALNPNNQHAREMLAIVERQLPAPR
ncbi:MAG TPA: tetratricopeptide repeat protein [Bryobacteraceae bacterium]|nr:tetratricopeptide repeat protein [Bryobacteraceae bacterium]